MEITQELLKEYIEYDKETGDLFWIKDRGYRVKAGDKFGCFDKSTGYIACEIFGFRNLAHRFVWFYHYGYWPDMLDHKDRDKTNNKLNNLRETTSLLNSHNVDKTSHSSKYPGVGFHKASGKWRVRTRVNGKRLEIGRYKTELEAKDAYEKYNSYRL